jgi:hypothetical protein
MDKLLCGSTNFLKNLLIHKISNLELIVKGVVTPLKCCPT